MASLVATLSSSFCSASSPFLFSKREEAVLHCKSELHHYHINCISLLTTFDDSDLIKEFSKSEGRAWMVSSLGGGREKAALGYFSSCLSDFIFALSSFEKT